MEVRLLQEEIEFCLNLLLVNEPKVMDFIPIGGGKARLTPEWKAWARSVAALQVALGAEADD